MLPEFDPHYGMKTGVALVYGTGTADRQSSGIDTRGFGGISFLVQAVAIGGSSVLVYKLQQSDDDGGSDDYTDIASSGVTMADTDDDTLVRLTVIEPQKRYLRVYVDKDTSHTDAEVIIYELFRAKSEPCVLTGLSHTVHLMSPAEGTA